MPSEATMSNNRKPRYPEKVTLFLERVFTKEQHPTAQLLDRIAAKAKLTRLQVSKWFWRKRFEQEQKLLSTTTSVTLPEPPSPSASKPKTQEKNAKDSKKQIPVDKPSNLEDAKPSEIHNLKQQVAELSYRLNASEFLLWQQRFLLQQMMSAQLAHLPAWLSTPSNPPPPPPPPPPSTFNPPSSTFNSSPPSTLNPSPSTLNSPPSIFNSPQSTFNSPPSAFNPSPPTFNPPPPPPPPQSSDISATHGNPEQYEKYQNYSSTTLQLVPYTNYSLQSPN